MAVGYLNGSDRARKVEAEITTSGRRACSVKVDQTDPASVDRAVKQVLSDLGGLDILVNNAAIATGGHDLPPGDLDALTPDIWDELMAVNVRGPYTLARAAAIHLKQSKWGRIVNVGSTLGHGDWYADRAFSPSKAAVIPLTRFLAASLAPDVTVNCVSPGLMVGTALGSGGPQRLYDSWRERAALGITTSIDDVAGQVVYLCKASTITGQSIVVDGGIHVH